MHGKRRRRRQVELTQYYVTPPPPPPPPPGGGRRNSEQCTSASRLYNITPPRPLSIPQYSLAGQPLSPLALVLTKWIWLVAISVPRNTVQVRLAGQPANCTCTTKMYQNTRAHIYWLRTRRKRNSSSGAFLCAYAFLCALCDAIFTAKLSHYNYIQYLHTRVYMQCQSTYIS